MVIFQISNEVSLNGKFSVTTNKNTEIFLMLLYCVLGKGDASSRV